METRDPASITQQLPACKAVEQLMLRALFLLIILAVSHEIEAVPDWRRHDRFAGSKKEHLQDWILHAEKGLTTLVGQLPYTCRMHFRPKTWARDRHQ